MQEQGSAATFPVLNIQKVPVSPERRMDSGGVRKSIQFKQLVHELALPSSAHALGYLLTLWEWAVDSGTPELGSVADVELLAEWQGEEGALFSALERSRWVVRSRFNPGAWEIRDHAGRAPKVSGSSWKAPGFVYLFSGSGGLCKIGHAVEVGRRLSQVGREEGAPVVLFAARHFKDRLRVERQLHYRYAHRRVRGEWFGLDPGERAAVVEFLGGAVS